MRLCRVFLHCFRNEFDNLMKARVLHHVTLKLFGVNTFIFHYI